jgi:hypothetical protein
MSGASAPPLKYATSPARYSHRPTRYFGARLLSISSLRAPSGPRQLGQGLRRGAAGGAGRARHLAPDCARARRQQSLNELRGPEVRNPYSGPVDVRNAYSRNFPYVGIVWYWYR